MKSSIALLFTLLPAVVALGQQGPAEKRPPVIDSIRAVESKSAMKPAGALDSKRKGGDDSGHDAQQPPEGRPPPPPRPAEPASGGATKVDGKGKPAKGDKPEKADKPEKRGTKPD